MSPKYHAERDRLRTVSERLRFAANQPLRFEPGSAHPYSNAGYVLLGAVIERVSGLPYDDYIRERDTRPAGMEHTGFFEKDAPTPNVARGYLPEGASAGLRLLPPLEGPSDGLRRLEPSAGEPPRLGSQPPERQGLAQRRGEPPRPEPERHPSLGPAPGGGWQDNYDTLPAKGNPSGGAYPTAEDMLKFFQALFAGERLSPEYAALATAGKVATPKGRYAYGFEELREFGIRAVGHSGGAPGVSAFAYTFPDRGYTVVILSNHEDGASAPYRKWIEPLSAAAERGRAEY